ncbi:MAG: DNA topoisomerase IV [Flavobacteriaceae bacterium]|nr:DNA topoisomerase IV [Flavobacteriaceae bacterium]HBY69578.1 DNA topoisomerase IV [Flavobacteriaceae bacterium]|tara:strand:+ start:4216 stop:4587 length:372 start_codon:yes stop_codon:yes gene_type:complete
MRLLTSTLFLFTLISCYQPERDCKKFKTGTFEFKALVGTQLETTTFKRNDSIEIDYYQGKADTSSIRWINDCEYIVQKINPKNRAEEKAIHMKILTTDNNEYTFEYNIVGQTNKQKGTAVKVK